MNIIGVANDVAALSETIKIVLQKHPKNLVVEWIEHEDESLCIGQEISSGVLVFECDGCLTKSF